MCNMCIYSSIPLHQLLTSNPWLEDDLSDMDENTLPSSIVVESPYAKKYTAWSNPHRFPSLRQNACPGQQKPASTSVTILGPSELSKQMPPIAYQAYHPEPRQQTNKKLQQQYRAPAQRLSICTSRSSSTEDVSSFSSPESEDEFLYLQDSRSTSKTTRPITYVVRSSKPKKVEVPAPLKLQKRHTDWMNDACRNF